MALLLKLLANCELHKRLVHLGGREDEEQLSDEEVEGGRHRVLVRHGVDRRRRLDAHPRQVLVVALGFLLCKCRFGVWTVCVGSEKLGIHFCDESRWRLVLVIIPVIRRVSLKFALSDDLGIHSDICVSLRDAGVVTLIGIGHFLGHGSEITVCVQFKQRMLAGCVSIRGHVAKLRLNQLS